MPRPIYAQAWFWMFLIALILFIIALIGYEINSANRVPMWVWVLFFLSLLLMILAFIIYAIMQGAIAPAIMVLPICPAGAPCALVRGPIIEEPLIGTSVIVNPYVSPPNPCGTSPCGNVITPDSLYS